MPTVVVNDLTVEPQTTPRKDVAAPPEEAGGPKEGPELERAVEKLGRRAQQRALRQWAY